NTIYPYWLKTKKHIAIQDNSDFWKQHNEDWKHSKLFPFERSPKKNISIFFDDNIKLDNTQKNIVAPYDIHTQQFIDVKTTFEEGYTYPVEPLKAIEDDNYFIEMVKATLEKV